MKWSLYIYLCNEVEFDVCSFEEDGAFVYHVRLHDIKDVVLFPPGVCNQLSRYCRFSLFYHARVFEHFQRELVDYEDMN